MIKRKHKQLSESNVERISEKYHNWRNIGGSYCDEIGFCRSVKVKEVIENNYVLAPARYVSAAEQEINLEISFNQPRIPQELNKLSDTLIDNISSINTAWNSTNQYVNIKNIIELENASRELNLLAQNLYQSAVKKYFIDLELNSNGNRLNIDKLPEGWSYKTFGELFTESKANVESIGYCLKYTA